MARYRNASAPCEAQSLPSVNRRLGRHTRTFADGAHGLAGHHALADVSGQLRRVFRRSLCHFLVALQIGTGHFRRCSSVPTQVLGRRGYSRKQRRSFLAHVISVSNFVTVTGVSVMGYSLSLFRAPKGCCRWYSISSVCTPRYGPKRKCRDASGHVRSWR